MAAIQRVVAYGAKIQNLLKFTSIGFTVLKFVELISCSTLLEYESSRSCSGNLSLLDNSS